MSLLRLAVLGSGAWGCALAMQLVRAGHQVRLWSHNAHTAQQLQQTRQVSQLPGVRLPEAIEPTASLVDALRGADGVLIAVPSHAFDPLLCTLADMAWEHPLPGQLAWATKGFDPQGHTLLHRRVAERLPQLPATVLSGPTFAAEVAKGLPTAMVAASRLPAAASFWSQALHGATFRVYTHVDVTGVEVGGAVKNVMAIAAGVSDGLGFGANARAALVARALAEVMRLGKALGAQEETFMGLTGLGDLVLTCTDDQSRNRRFGLALARGEPPSQAEAAIGTVEGIAAARSVVALAQQHQLDMPIASQVLALIDGSVSAREAVSQLLARAPKAESA